MPKEEVQYHSFDLNPETTALIIVDMENDWCRPGGHRYFPEVEPVIPRLKGLRERCRANNVQVIYSHSVRFKDSPEFVRFGQEPFIIKGTWGATIIEELHPQPEDSIVEKHSHDIFYQTKMDSTLQNLRILPETHTILCTGVALNVCVYHAILGFHLRKYNVVVPMDCCAVRPGFKEYVEKQFSGHAYNFNVKMTTSAQISFAPVKQAAAV
jgi:nicotinamidase-related amidase